MAFGKVSFGSLQPLDLDKVPGPSPIISLTQRSRESFDALVGIPNTDADGSELTGATQHALATGFYNEDGSLPAQNMSMEEITAVYTTIHTALVATDPGTNKVIAGPVLDIASGRKQWVASAVTDDVIGETLRNVARKV